ncbi:MAG: Acetyltransferase, GNAT family [Lachnoclostridium sp.]|jgi:ribosomal protein S18 acetylase RimI-like enzyme
MILYKVCTEVSLSQIYNAFCRGFADYSIPFHLSEDEFFAHFFGLEGNELKYSFIALDNENPVGLILGGTRVFDCMKTMRCGAFCIAPDYRKKGIGRELFQLHQAAAKEAGCKQLFLEVLKSNHRAIQFYEKAGYRISVILKYYHKKTSELSVPKEIPPYKITSIRFDVVKGFREKLNTCHINWQSDIFCYEDSKTDIFYGVYDDYQLIALTAISTKGKINFLWVEPSYRFKGIGRFLLHQASKQVESESLYVCIPGNALLEGFFRKLEFEKDTLEQYEMYLPL